MLPNNLDLSSVTSSLKQFGLLGALVPAALTTIAVGLLLVTCLMILLARSLSPLKSGAKAGFVVVNIATVGLFWYDKHQAALCAFYMCVVDCLFHLRTSSCQGRHTCVSNSYNMLRPRPHAVHTVTRFRNVKMK